MALLLVPPPEVDEIVEDEWLRNPLWPEIVAPLETEQKIVGLYAVWPGDGVGKGANFFAFLAQGDYTIDYGDGTIANYTSDTRADYEFDFNNPQLAGTNAPVTFTVSTNTVNRAAHGLQNGSSIRFFDLVNTTGIVPHNLYYIVNATADSFQISDTIGGAVVDLTGTDGSATLLPYKLAIVTITPQPGQNLTVVNFVQRNGTLPVTTVFHCSSWLDIAMSIPQVSGTGLTIGTPNGPGTTAPGMAERINIVSVGALTTMRNLFQGCRSLKSLPKLPDATTVTNMESMFFFCYNLKTIPPFPGSVAAVTNMQFMFFNCRNLSRIWPFPGSISAVTNMQSMFSACYILESVPPFPSSTSAVTNISNMFAQCFNLKEVPPMNTSGVSSSANFNQAFSISGNFSRIQATGQRFTFSVADNRLSAAALNEIFSGLATVTGQTITVTGNCGILEAGYNPTIATSKGWTVTA
jgi:hypothetical protein